MGWWKVQGTENTVGDRPLDVLGNAVSEVLAQYEAHLKRRPTKGEWEALLQVVLGGQDGDERILQVGVVARVVIESG